jgi:hypothetical protein
MDEGDMEGWMDQNRCQLKGGSLWPPARRTCRVEQSFEKVEYEARFLRTVSRRSDAELEMAIRRLLEPAEACSVGEQEGREEIATIGDREAFGWPR